MNRTLLLGSSVHDLTPLVVTAGGTRTIGHGYLSTVWAGQSGRRGERSQPLRLSLRRTGMGGLSLGCCHFHFLLIKKLHKSINKLHKNIISRSEPDNSGADCLDFKPSGTYWKLRRTSRRGSPSKREHPHFPSLRSAPQTGHRPRQSSLHRGFRGRRSKILSLTWSEISSVRPKNSTSTGMNPSSDSRRVSSPKSSPDGR